MKRVTAIFGASISLLVGLVLLSACTNILSPSAQPEGSTQGGVSIRIAGNHSAIRTLYPTAEFTKYTLDFTHHGTSSHSRIELTGGKNSVVITDLADGTWNITAIGWVSIDIDDNPDLGPIVFEAARGTEEITVSGGTAQSETIDLSAEMGADDGYFSWDINIPGDAEIQTASLTVTKLGTYGSPIIDTDLLTTPADRQGIRALDAGYYLMQLSVFNGYQRLGHTEVLAVYSNMETTAKYTFTGADFVPAVKMSGTVNLSNTEDVKSIDIFVRKSNGQYVNRVTIPVAGDAPYTWEIYAPASDSPSTVRFYICYYSDNSWIYIDTGKTSSLGSVDVPNIDLGTVNIATITIGGTIQFTGIDQAPDYIRIYSNDLNYGQGYQVTLGEVINKEAQGTWSMKIPASLAGSKAEFRLGINTGGTNIQRDLGTRTLPATDDPAITFPTVVDLSTVTWNGTINLTVNGSFPQGTVGIQAYEKTSGSWQQLGSGQVNPDGTWSITLSPYSGTKQIQFNVGQGSYWLNLEERSLQGSTQSGIDLGSHTYITLSGSVAVTLNGIPVTSGNDYNINVNAYPNENYSGNQLGNAYVDTTGTWTMLVEASSPAQTYYFEVSVYDYAAENSVRKGTGVSRQGSTSPITGINLGTLAFNTVTWNGTINLTVNGSFPQGTVYIQAYDRTSWQQLGSGQVNPDGTWSITLSPYSGTKQIQFDVGQGSYWLNLEERSLQGSTQSGIDLGSHTYITLSGSVAVTLNGIPVTSGNDYSINVHAYPNENYSGNQLDNAKVDPTGTWTMLVEASSPAQTYYFEVSVYDYAAENLVRKGTGVSRQGSTSPITGINLGTLAFNN